jgi:hypothetical protein
LALYATADDEALSLAIGSVTAGGAAYAIERRKPPLRFGLPATAISVTVI